MLEAVSASLARRSAVGRKALQNASAYGSLIFSDGRSVVGGE